MEVITKGFTSILLPALIWLMMLTPAHAAMVDASTSELDLKQQIYWLKSTDDSLSIAQVSAMPLASFREPGEYTFSKGYTKDAYWLRFELDFQQQSENKDWILEIPFALLDYLDLYVPEKDGTLAKIAMGDRLPFEQRPLQVTNFAYPLSPAAGLNRYFIHVRTQDSLQVPLKLYTRDSFTANQVQYSSLQGLYFGCMLVMILYNLFIYLSVKERSYLYYIFYISLWTLFQASLQGYTFQYLWPDNTRWANISIPFFGVLALFFATLFCRNLLQTERHLPRFDNTLVIISCALLGALPFVLFGDYDTGILLSLASTFVFFNMIIFAAIRISLKGNTTARNFSIAWGIFLLSGSASLLGITGILPLEYANVHILQLGSILEVVLLSLILADRINIIEDEKTKIEAESKRTLIEANKQLENSNKLKNEFISTISHEIRTPMNGILGSAQLMQDTLLNDIQKDYLSTIMNSGTTLLEILDNILDYSKIEANKLTIKAETFDLQALLNECCGFFAPLASESKVPLSINLQNNTPRYLVGDPVRIKQILLNLISNAYKFTAEGEINIHVRPLPDTDLDIYFEIEDSGLGLSQEDQERLFQPFVQLDSTTSRFHGGTGLGLAICKRLTELMGGHIGVSSALGTGSRFWFSIHSRASSEEKMTGSNSQYQLQADCKNQFICPNLKVLAIDDNETNIKVLSGFLDKFQVQADYATNGEDAIQKSIDMQHSYDLILMDIEMPGTDGYDTTREIRRLERWQRVRPQPIVALSAHAVSEFEDKALQCGMNDFLAKPVSKTELKNMLQTILEQKNSRRQKARAVSDPEL